MIKILRKETRELHSELEAVTGSEKIQNGTFTLPEYKKYIQTNYYFYHTVEQKLFTHQNEIPHDLLHPYERKTSYLEHDLQALQVDITNNTFNLSGNSLPHLMGYMYVAEGSMLGAQIINKLIQNRSQLQEVEDFHFLSCCNEHRKLWAFYKKYMNQQEWSEAEKQTIVNAAKEAFMLYKQIYQKIEKQAA